MNISNELIEKTQNASRAEELLEMAKAANIELLDDELDNVAGGCGDDEDKVAKTRFKVDDYVTKRGGFYCYTCGVTHVFKVIKVHKR